MCRLNTCPWWHTPTPLPHQTPYVESNKLYFTLINISGFAFKLSLNVVKETISQEGMSQPTLSNCPCLLESEDAHITSNTNIYYIYISFLAFQLRRVYLWEGCSTLLLKSSV